MPVPEVHSFLLPYLQALADGKELRDAEIKEHISEFSRLTPIDRQEMMPKGRYLKLDSRVYQVMRHLVQAELVRSRRARMQSMTRGPLWLSRQHLCRAPSSSVRPPPISTRLKQCPWLPPKRFSYAPAADSSASLAVVDGVVPQQPPIRSAPRCDQLAAHAA